jgi:hypothetical protein
VAVVLLLLHVLLLVLAMGASMAVRQQRTGVGWGWRCWYWRWWSSGVAFGGGETGGAVGAGGTVSVGAAEGTPMFWKRLCNIGVSFSADYADLDVRCSLFLPLSPSLSIYLVRHQQPTTSPTLV